MPISKKADTPRRKRMHRHVEASMKARGASPGAATRAANAAVRDDKRKRRKRKGK